MITNQNVFYVENIRHFSTQLITSKIKYTKVIQSDSVDYHISIGNNLVVHKVIKVDQDYICSCHQVETDVNHLFPTPIFKEELKRRTNLEHVRKYRTREKDKIKQLEQVRDELVDKLENLQNILSGKQRLLDILIENNKRK